MTPFKTEVSQRVRAWVLDIDGRMDFLHALNIEKRRHQRETKTPWRRYVRPLI